MAQTYGIRNRRARQRALLISAGPEEHDLSELAELLRTAGVAVAGELTQKRATPDSDSGRSSRAKRSLHRVPSSGRSSLAETIGQA